MLEDSQPSVKCQQLLRELKSTVEGLLASQVPNVWSVFGGLNRLHNSVEKIFKHASVGCNEDGVSGYWSFIQGLEWLQPESTKSYVYVDCTYKPPIPIHMKNDKASIWLYRSLECHCLSQQLSWLLSDKNHLNSCYQPHAFLRQTKYTEAMLICLRSVERNQASLLSEINPSLFLSKVSAKEFHKIHRRCSSFPDSHLKHLVLNESVRSKTLSDIVSETVEFNCSIRKGVVYGKIKPWSSMPCLHSKESILQTRHQCKTTPSTPTHLSKFSPATFRSFHSQKRKNLPKKGILKKASKPKPVIIDNLDIVEHTPPLSSSQSSGTYVNEVNRSSRSGSKSPMHKIIPEYARTTRAGQKDYRRHPKRSFMEDGGMKVQPVATGYFPRPLEGQTLMSFLTSNQFSKASAELDRENAHFNISEAMISAMEQIRCRRDMALAEDQAEESDPEIVDLKQRIRLRRRQKLVEMQRKMWTVSLMSDGRTDTTTEASVSPYSTSPYSSSDSISTEDVEDLEVDDVSNLADDKGLSMSMASLFSEADLFKKQREAPDGASDILSAESVALSLISKFNEKQLPRASELEWLVSEKDAPQALLPLPKSWPVSPDDSDEPPVTPLRGTKEWAPPRPQIIFTLHPSPDRKHLMTKQNYRCAGCSMKVAPKYASRFRYCDYLGRYFCTFCHTNQLALIPARILQKWDFTRYPVSNFSYRLLEQMYADPLFRVFDLNKNIGKRSKNLLFCRKCRQGLHYMRDFIFSCRHAENIQELFQKELPNRSLDPEMYSIEELVMIRNGEMKTKLKYLVELCCRHTSECELCLARGFICEVCRNDEPIFPWQMRTVTRCLKCGSCYHSSCWNQQKPCQKCQRINKRHEK